MHGATCVFWASLTPPSLQNRIIRLTFRWDDLATTSEATPAAVADVLAGMIFPRPRATGGHSHAPVQSIMHRRMEISRKEYA